MRVALQALTFLAGVALLAYAASVAFGPENQKHLVKLKDAPPSSIALLLLLSLISLALNGLVFWLTLRPVRSTHAPDILATNALAAFLAYAPFKLGLLLRVGIHTRRDRVPLPMVGAWFASVAVTILSTLGALTAVSLLHRRLDALWVGMALGALVAVWAVIVWGSKLMAGETGLKRLAGLLGGLSPKLGALVLSERFRQLHSATSMLASPGHVGLSMGLRVVDIALQAARVPIAAGVLGLSLPYTDAFLIACTSFLVGILSPTGPLGSREVTVILVCKKLGIPDAESFAIVALLVSSAEAAAYGLGAVASILWLGPTRLFTPRAGAEAGRVPLAASQP